MTKPMTAIDDASVLVQAIVDQLPRIVDGRDAIDQMRRGGSSHWRQMEWIGFWFEHFCEREVLPITGARRGPRFGNTTFDARRHFVWDLKAHPRGADLILNDCEAVDACVRAHRGLGFIVVEGDVRYDTDGSFKAWHDAYKGGRSVYEAQRVARGAPSRRRKVSFRPSAVDAFFFADAAEIQTAVHARGLDYFQTGMRNADGSPRRSKYLLRPPRVPRANHLLRASVDANRSLPLHRTGPAGHGAAELGREWTSFEVDLLRHGLAARRPLEQLAARHEVTLSELLRVLEVYGLRH